MNNGANGARTVSLPDAARALGLSKGAAYEAVRRGDFPVDVIRAGHTLRVPTAALDRVLGEPDTPEPVTALLNNLMSGNLDRAGRLATLGVLAAIGKAAEAELERAVRGGE